MVTIDLSMLRDIVNEYCGEKFIVVFTVDCEALMVDLDKPFRSKFDINDARDRLKKFLSDIFKKEITSISTTMNSDMEFDSKVCIKFKEEE